MKKIIFLVCLILVVSSVTFLYKQENQRKVFERKSNDNLVSYEEAYKKRLKLNEHFFNVMKKF